MSILSTDFYNIDTCVCLSNSLNKVISTKLKIGFTDFLFYRFSTSVLIFL